jgi:FMN reductase
VIVKVSVVVGNPKSKSRTLKVAVALARELFSPGECNCQVIDLVEHVDEILDSSSDDLAAINASVAASDLVVFASPTYKATYTGLLKAFLDRFPVNGLSGVTAIPVMAGSDLSHSMDPTVNLAPVLVELGATVPGRGFYFVASQMDCVDELVARAASEYAANIRCMAALATALGTRTVADLDGYPHEY